MNKQQAKNNCHHGKSPTTTWKVERSPQASDYVEDGEKNPTFDLDAMTTYGALGVAETPSSGHSSPS